METWLKQFKAMQLISAWEKGVQYIKWDLYAASFIIGCQRKQLSKISLFEGVPLTALIAIFTG